MLLSACSTPDVTSTAEVWDPSHPAAHLTGLDYFASLQAAAGLAADHFDFQPVSLITLLLQSIHHPPPVPSPPPSSPFTTPSGSFATPAPPTTPCSSQATSITVLATSLYHLSLHHHYHSQQIPAHRLLFPAPLPPSLPCPSIMTATTSFTTSADVTLPGSHLVSI